MNKLNLQILTIGLLLSFSVLKVNGQVLQNRVDIVKENGYGYESGVADDGTKYIYYDKEFTTEQSGTYTQRKVIYFTKLDDGTEICSFWRILEPESETNPNVSYMKKELCRS